MYHILLPVKVLCEVCLYRKIVTGTNIFFSVVSVMRVMSVGGVISGLNSLNGYCDHCRDLCQFEVIECFWMEKLESFGVLYLFQC